MAPIFVGALLYHSDRSQKPQGTTFSGDSNPEAAVLQSLTVPYFVFLAELKRELAGDSNFLYLSAKVAANPSSFLAFRLIDGLLYRYGRIWLSPSCKFRSLLLREFHEIVIRGHAGVIKTLKRLSENFFWPNMRKEVHELWLNVGFFRKRNTPPYVRRDCFSLSLLPLMFGRIY